MNNELYESYVLETKKQKSITKAAAVLGISQPALSMGLTQFENELGFQIFNRKTTPIRVTEAGEVFCEYLIKKQALNIEYKIRIGDLIQHSEGHLVIGAPTAYIASVLIDAISVLYQLHPEYRIDIESASVPELVALADNSIINCFISTTSIRKVGFENIPVKQERTFLCVPASSDINKLLKESRNDNLLELMVGYPFVFLKPDQPMQITLDQALSKRKIVFKHSFTVNQISSALYLAANGCGACLATEESLKVFSDLDKLKLYSLEHIIPDRTIYVSYHKDHYMPSSCKDLIKILKEGKL